MRAATDVSKMDLAILCAGSLAKARQSLDKAINYSLSHPKVYR